MLVFCFEALIELELIVKLNLAQCFYVSECQIQPQIYFFLYNIIIIMYIFQIAL